MTGMKAFIGVLAILFFGLQYKLWFDDGSIFDVLKIRDDYKLQQNNYRHLTDVNHKLTKDIHALKSGGDVLEEKAREELGMVKEGEVYFQIIEP